MDINRIKLEGQLLALESAMKGELRAIAQQCEKYTCGDPYWNNLGNTLTIIEGALKNLRSLDQERIKVQQ